MISFLIRITLGLLVINQMLSPCVALGSSRGYASSGKYAKESSFKVNAPNSFNGDQSSGLLPQNTTKKGLGISAWGLVAVIITIILAGMGFYYFAMCYPILCKKQRKYDMIGLPNVA